MNRKIRSKIVASTLLCTMCAYTLPVFAYMKDETVYSKMNSKGQNYRTIVSTQIENSEKLKVINDITDLLNIENTNGEEKFTQDGDSLVWKADEKDIYYQGESQKDLPIECKVKYELDGNEVTPDEILGKTGHVKVTVEYINKEEHIVNIEGKEQKLYTPFVAVCGSILQNDTNKNIEISNGKVINDGSKTFVIGIAMPGLKESLGINKDELEIPSSIEITMDASDFELGSIITFVTPKVIEENDFEFLDKLDEIYNQVNTLEDASNQIQEGSVNLAKGTNQLALGTTELKEGSNVAYKGAKQIETEISKATKQLANDKSEALDSKMLNAIGEQAKQSANLSDTQKAQIGSQAQNSAVQSIQSQKAAIGQKAESKVENLTLTQAEKQEIAKNVEASLKLNDTYKALSEAEKAVVLQFAKSSAISAAESTAKETAKQVANKTAQTVAEEVVGSMANDVAQLVAQNVAGQIAQITATTTAKQVANEVKSQAQNKVIEQMQTLQNGVNQLTNGLCTLNEGTNSLESGADELNAGAKTLVDGIKTFNEEGIKKICNYINGDLKDVTDRIEKLKELSKQYNNFTMLNGENDGNVKFIMIMDSIKKQENEDSKKEEIILDNKKDGKQKESTK